jgi:hypothetical protein
MSLSALVLRNQGIPRARELARLATFPAFGSTPVIVIGRAEATGKTSTSWVLTVCHEHLHQLQMAAPDYCVAVDSLDLSEKFCLENLGNAH